ncbi:MAG TPA: hypothetical protein VEC36_04450 [Patescibacteria group bacterium]|nr:hypothetical protein [Patescibacteria group bacterium]
MQLKNIFHALLENYTKETILIEELWLKLKNLYSHKNRYYHNLAHLEFLLKQLKSFKTGIKDWDSVLFALFYHDAIYDTSRNDNEEKSAELAIQTLQSADVPDEIITKCYKHILATKHHAMSTDADTNIFTDADLSILGASWEEYLVYAQNIRKEYAMYPDEAYQAGRVKVLQHFLSMERIFKTDVFFESCESPARENLAKELEFLKT